METPDEVNKTQEADGPLIKDISMVGTFYIFYTSRSQGAVDLETIPCRCFLSK